MSEAPTLPRFSGERYVTTLQRRGFEVIGQGGGYSIPASYVLAKPGSDAVVKVGTIPAGDPWPLFAAWCIENPGPFRPTVRSLRWHGEGASRFFVATMDRLYPVDWRENQPLVRALSDWYEVTLSMGIDRRDWHDGPMDPRLVLWLAYRIRDAGLPQIADHIHALLETFPSLRWDPQPCNWMRDDDGRLVLIDPFTRTLGDVPETAPRIVVNERSRYGRP